MEHFNPAPGSLRSARPQTTGIPCSASSIDKSHGSIAVTARSVSLVVPPEDPGGLHRVQPEIRLGRDQLACGRRAPFIRIGICFATMWMGNSQMLKLGRATRQPGFCFHPVNLTVGALPEVSCEIFTRTSLKQGVATGGHPNEDAATQSIGAAEYVKWHT